LIHLTPPRIPPPPGFRDVLTARAGVEWLALQEGEVGLLVRGGAAYEPTPVPEQSGLTSYADGDKATISAGVGVTSQKPWGLLAGAASVDVHAGFTWLIPRANHRLDPAQPDFLASGFVWQTGTTLRLRF
jgi:long-chain fatty acid transport protein